MRSVYQPRIRVDVGDKASQEPRLKPTLWFFVHVYFALFAGCFFWVNFG